MSIMSPHPTEKEDEECQTASLENGSSSPTKNDVKCTNGSNGSAPILNTEVGAKRRKPLKTNKVTQQVQVNIYQYYAWNKFCRIIL